MRRVDEDVDGPDDDGSSDPDEMDFSETPDFNNEGESFPLTGA
jgi:hypothetical protein